ncbi:YqgE/AlgH family protein [Psychromonas antarctica]|jgi:putative transcriptional regulator|uniref:YqgE/AlgH family protein n=1 Tax=Psychromonas antarctica TaxID=67573 RepID=UPI001EE78E04|nr:YqgE/AlgH family protein [Psychromonas antarctica]MCG6202876.1 YqgE/AlgH family protein [Psychromonas antarctica]
MSNAKITTKDDNPAIQRSESEIKVSHKTEVLSTLKNHFLIAMPSLTDPYFKQSVVYVCEHDAGGAMGFIINFPVKLTLQELLNNVETISHQPEPPLLGPVFLGGPLELERGFVLHSPAADNSQSTQLNEQLMMSNSNAVLSSLGTENAPEQYIVTLGYASWEAGQLEQEIKDNHWLTIKSENDIIFNTPVEKRWTESLHRLGINPDQLSTSTGHA